MIATLRQGNFLRLWIGGLISVIGDWALGIGLPIYVYVLTHSVLALSLALVSISVPSILLGSVAGVFVDRWNRKRTLVVTNLLLALGLLPLLLVRSADRVWIVYAVSFLVSTLEQFSVPAQNALIPTLVNAEHLVPANALNSLSSNLARLIGPALGGLTAATIGLTGIVLVDATSFLFAAIVIAGIVLTGASVLTPQRPKASEGGAGRRVWQELADGIRAIMADRALTVLLAVFAVVSLGEGVFGTLYAVYVYQVLHGGPLEIGELMSAQAVGGLTGGLLVGWVGKRLLSRWAIGFSMAAFGAIDLAIFNIAALFPLALQLSVPVFSSTATFPIFWLAVGLFIVVGVPGIAALAGLQSQLQAASPETYRGRIFGALGAITGLFRLIGVVTAGAVTIHLGVVAVLNIQGAGYLLAGLVVIALLPRHGLQSDPLVLTPSEQERTRSSA